MNGFWQSKGMTKIKKVGLGLIGIGVLILFGIWLVLKTEPATASWTNHQTVVAVSRDRIQNSENEVAECADSN